MAESKVFTNEQKIAYYQECLEFYRHQIFALGRGDWLSKKGFTYRQEYNHCLARLRDLRTKTG